MDTFPRGLSSTDAEQLCHWGNTRLGGGKTIGTEGNLQQLRNTIGFSSSHVKCLGFPGEAVSCISSVELIQPCVHVDPAVSSTFPQASKVLEQLWALSGSSLETLGASAQSIPWHGDSFRKLVLVMRISDTTALQKQAVEKKILSLPRIL